MSNGNTYHRVIEDLRVAVEAGAPGSRLPSVRELVSRHRVGPVTAQRALSQLVREGVVETKPGRGSFVAARPATLTAGDLSWQTAALGGRTVPTGGLAELLGAPGAGGIPLTCGYLSEDLQPLSQLAAAASRAARRPGVWGRIAPEGLVQLREWFARGVGGGMRAHDVVITPGGQAALSTTFRALAAPGSAVVVESPTYIGALAAIRAAGLRAVPVPTDADGVQPDSLAEALQASRARLFYCQPTYANPHGVTLAPERRAAVLDAVSSAGAFLVEDDPARDLFLHEPPPPPLASLDARGHVVYVRSLTKVGAPGLRVAALCARGAAGVRLRSARIVDDFFVSGVLQEAALELVSLPAWRRHLRRVRKVLLDRQRALVGAVGEGLSPLRITLVPRGGLHLWLQLPDGFDDLRIAEEAKAGVIVSAGRHWFPAEPPGTFLRLSYSGADAETLLAGVAVLAGAFANAPAAADETPTR